jgi:hypothetical protein
MKLELIRDMCGTACTVGKLYLDGDFFCYILEDTDRKLEEGGEKIHGQTAIPRGTYEVIIDFSNRFQRELPRLLDVPGYSGVRIHPGNTSADTEGCLLPGLTRTDMSVGQSRAAFNRLYERLNLAYAKNDPIMLVIS